MNSLEMFFVLLLFLSIYSYGVYPLLTAMLASLVHRPWRKAEGENRPRVTIIISAYNEEKNIKEKINNSLALEYPQDKVEIVVSSDGSTDGTNGIVEGVRDERIVLRPFPDRMGKTACLNEVIPDSSGEIIVFTDANSMFEADMLRHLVRNFHDPDVGAVSGWTKYRNPESGEETTGLYAKLEKRTKQYECAVSSCVGADGAIFAIRKGLYTPLGANDINDFIIPLNVIKQGKRVVLDESIFCIEESTEGVTNIFKRQIRITTRTAWALRRNLDLLNVFQFGSFSFFLISHKALRLLTPFFLLFTFLLNLFILQRSAIYFAVLIGLLLFFIIGLIALSGIGKGRIWLVCMYFLITFAAQVVGCIRMVAGIEDIMWTPKR